MKKVYILLIIILLWNGVLSYQMIANKNGIVKITTRSDKNDAAFVSLQTTIAVWLEVLINKTRHLKYKPDVKTLKWL